MKRLSGKTAVVTAAASGIGKATAIRLAREGANVVAVDLDKNVEETASSLRNEGHLASFKVFDCSDRDSVESSFRDIYRDVGSIDILVNGVGRSAGEKLGEFWCSDPEVWNFVINVSLKSTMICSRQVVPQ